MVSKERRTYWIVIAVLAAIIFFLRECSGPKEDCPEPKLFTVTEILKGDSIPYEVKVRVPVPYKVEVHDTVFTDVDTAAILTDYFIHRTYKDTLKDDTSALIVIEETVGRNRILDRRLWYQNRRPISITNHITQWDTCPPPRRKVFVGLSMSFGRDVFDVGAGLSLLNKNEHRYSIMYHPNLGILPERLEFGTSFKIRLRKK